MVNGWYHDAKDCYHNNVNQVRYACCHLHIHIHTHKIVRNVRWVHTYIQTINAWCMWCIWCIYVCCMCAMCKCFVIVFYMRAIQCKHANAWPGQIHSASPSNWLTIIACYLTLLLFCSLEVFSVRLSSSSSSSSSTTSPRTNQRECECVEYDWRCVGVGACALGSSAPLFSLVRIGARCNM